MNFADASCTWQEGCNHMKCPCGVHYCYQCGKEISSSNPYEHYSRGKCSSDTDTNKLNAQRVRTAGPSTHNQPRALPSPPHA